MSQDFNSTQNFRSRTLAFVQKSLGFSDYEKDLTNGLSNGHTNGHINGHLDAEDEKDPVISSFGIVGEAIVSDCTLGKLWQEA